MKAYRYILEPYNGMSTRYTCPGCQKQRRFTRYIDSESGDHVHTSVGRCDRIDKCGYHYTPKEYSQDNNIDTPRSHKPRIKKKPKPTSYIPFEIFKGSLQRHEHNNFVNYLKSLFGEEITNGLIERYFIGTSKKWEGGTVFWQIDTTGKIRTGKIMLYSTDTGKRVKEPYNHFTWAHKVLKQPEYVLQQCLFGSHLLKNNLKPCAIVESEKTAIIASVYLPQFTWLATGGISNLKEDTCDVLSGKVVTLFPDLKAFDKWSTKAQEMTHITTFVVSDLLESGATEAQWNEGWDLVDYLIQYDHKSFVQKPERIIQEEEWEEFEEIEEPNHWSNDIIDIESFFNGVDLPTGAIQLDRCTTVTDIPKFIETHLTTIKANRGKGSFMPYLNRLKELKIKLNT